MLPDYRVQLHLTLDRPLPLGAVQSGANAGKTITKMKSPIPLSQLTRENVNQILSAVDCFHKRASEDNSKSLPCDRDDSVIEAEAQWFASRPLFEHSPVMFGLLSDLVEWAASEGCVDAPEFRAARKLLTRLRDEQDRQALLANLPSTSAMEELVRELKPEAGFLATKHDEPCSDEIFPTEEAAEAHEDADGCIENSVHLTVGWSPKKGSWDYQTGDNSYTGGAYGHPHWAVVDVFASSEPLEIAKDILNQLADLVCS